jgi:hypothetical protein
LIVTYIDRQEAPDIPFHSLEQFGFGSDVWAGHRQHMRFYPKLN